jgi:hypothetical protein
MIVGMQIRARNECAPYGILWRVALMAVLAAGPVGAAEADGLRDTAREQAAGLMWNRTGLPAVFPLLVKTRPGRDYYMVLADAETGSAALAAYIKGGDFFRVLVPPGTYHVRFAYGLGWQGAERLFGPGDETGFYDLPEPQTFKVIGLARKSGHIIDLRGLVGPDEKVVAVDDLSICQRQLWTPDRDDYFSDLNYLADPIGRLRERATGPEREAVRDLGPRRPELRYDPYASPDYQTRSRVCE